uniref:Uncharacterized protein n=1 Tax=Sus scrofa TaxID=9823 RepID=A0A8D1CK59_PIG
RAHLTVVGCGHGSESGHSRAELPDSTLGEKTGAGGLLETLQKGAQEGAEGPPENWRYPGGTLVAPAVYGEQSELLGRSGGRAAFAVGRTTVGVTPRLETQQNWGSRTVPARVGDAVQTQTPLSPLPTWLVHVSLKRGRNPS